MRLHALRAGWAMLVLCASAGAQEFYQRGPVEALLFRSGKDKAFLTLTRRDGISPAERLVVGQELTWRGEEAVTDGLKLTLRETEAEITGDEKAWPAVLGLYRRQAEPERFAEARARAEKIDAELNRVYGEVRAKLNPRRADDLRDLQREWIRFAYEAGANAKGAPDAATAQYWQTRGDRAAERIHFLKEYAANTAAAHAQELQSQLAAAREAEAWPAVAEIARRMLAGAPRDSPIWETRARAFAASEDWGRCTTTLDEWAKAANPAPLVIHALRGDVAWAAEEIEEAAREWTIFIKATPKDYLIRDKLAAALEKQDKWADAAVIREQRVKALRDSAGLVRLAMARAVLRDWKRMGVEIRRASELDPTNDDAKAILPRVERIEKAMPELQRLDAAAAGGAANPLLDRAWFFASLKWPEIAVVDCSAALRRNPGSLRGRVQKAEALLALDRRPEAEDLEVALGTNTSAGGLRALGEADAELAAKGPSAAGFARRAHALNFVAQWKLALLDAASALELDARSDSALSARGEALVQSGKTWEALTTLTKATELNPRNAHAWYWRGEVESRHRNFAAAVEALSRVLELEPDHVDALTLRERNLRAAGRRAEADIDAAQLRLKLKRS